MESETAKGLFGVKKSSTRRKEPPSGGEKNRTLRSQQGGCSPMCRTPAAPTLYQSTASAHSIRLSIIAEPLAPLTSVSSGLQESPSHCFGPIISFGLTH